MRIPNILYALFCTGVVAMFIFAAGRSYSPFADGGARAFYSGARGPTHK